MYPNHVSTFAKSHKVLTTRTEKQAQKVHNALLFQFGSYQFQIDYRETLYGHWHVMVLDLPRDQKVLGDMILYASGYRKCLIDMGG